MNKFNPFNWGNKAPPPPPQKLPPIIKFLSMAEVKEYLGSENDLKIPLIRKGCEMMKIPFVGGGVLFFAGQPTLLEDFEKLKEELNNQLSAGVDYLVAYEKLDRPLTHLSYYRVIAIRSNDMLDFKKAFKVQKLKAFL